VLLTVDGEPVARPQDVTRIVSSHRPGERVALVFDRQGQNRIVAVGLAARPDVNDLIASQFIGNPAPHFQELKSVQGSFPLDMASLRGRVVVLEFWASWCMVCRLEVPVLNSWHDRYGARGLMVLGVTTDPVGYATEVALDLGITYPVASDPEVTTSRAYKAMSIPMLFVIDRNGTVRDVVVGYSSDRLVEVEARVQELLAAR
jgi:peroxiredoxin